jgi:molybdopterin molybdotransferase
MTEPLRCAAVDVARRRVLALVAPLPAEDRSLADALGACLAAPLVAPGPRPAFDNAAMDGYAVVAAHVDGRLPAEAVAIATGQRIPAGSDAVVPLERVDAAGRVAGPVRAGDHVRRRGEEFGIAARLLGAGEELTAAAIGLLAGSGVVRVHVHQRPRVAVLVSGDELLPTARRAPDELIDDANGPMLRALIADAGGELGELAHVPDDREALCATVQRLAAGADLVCTSGGASVGRPDHLIGVVADLGRLVVHQLAAKPGRPASFGLVGTTPVAVLPGNPFALLTGFELLARPALRRIAGAADPQRVRLRLAAAHRFEADEGRTRLVPVRIAASRAAALDGSGAAMLSGAARADGLAFIAAGASVEVDEPLEVELWRH